MHNWNIHTLGLAKFPYRFPNLWSENYHCKKGQGEATKTASIQEYRKPKGILFSPGEITENNATISDVKDTGVVIPITSPSNLLMWPLQKMDGSWRMIVDYQKLRQAVTTTAAALSDAVSLSSKLIPGTWYNQAERWNNEIKRCLLLGRKAMTNLDSLSKSRDITLPTKVHIVKAMVFPGFLYGCESWTIKKAEHERIDTSEL